MKYTLQDRLFGRELGLSDRSRYSSAQGLYSDRCWVDEMDIVNELGGHSGCVNALSWSRSGRLLASGSDDHHLNIHQYLPESSSAPFTLSTSVSTGHMANIFSVKFMPHSNDRTVVTAAGDSEVRVFDIEYSGRSVPASAPAALASSGRCRGLNNVYDGISFRQGQAYISPPLHESTLGFELASSLGPAGIVTENSPYLFLTCSEDGEIRQWDTRQPSSSYPASRGRRSLFSHSSIDHDNSNVPPPLISYKRYHLELNTISCSPNQPHYIALGGSHLHCFLHDRRMTGRDILAERGQPGSLSPPGTPSSDRENDSLNTATRCVRKFAPNGVNKMKTIDNGHITACKISDANPNEMIVSWSGDWIYSFDLIRSPDADGPESGPSETVKSGKGKGKAKESTDRRDRKRKRGQLDSSSSLEGLQRRDSKQREGDHEGNGDGELALRVRYENGQSEETRIESPPALGPTPVISQAREAILDEPGKESHRIADAVVNLRREMFGLKTSKANPSPHSPTTEITPHTASFTAALGLAATYLPAMDEVIRAWRYPVNPLEEDVIFQVTLRSDRESARRFVQAAGVLMRALGGELKTASRGKRASSEQFKQINPAPNEGNSPDPSTHFCYDFLKAILLWLEGGLGALCQGFKSMPENRRYASRFPIPEEAGLEAIDEVLIPHLLQLARSRPIPNVDASRFERDELLICFETETAAVTAFDNAIKIPFVEQRTGESGPGAEIAMTQDKRTALRFWGLKVARGVLMNAGEGVNFALVDRAFGGLGTSDRDDDVIEDTNVARTENNGPGSGSGAETANREANDREIRQRDSPPPSSSRSSTLEEGSLSEDEIILGLPGELSMSFESGSDDDDDSDADSDEEGSDEEGLGDRLLWAFDSGGKRAKIGRNTPCSSHTRQYRGHCNVKTVKDVNFFGLEDEYVVSGSDSGHVFIWDKKTSLLVNILKGDGEVVNVVQGHPFEPMLAVSGIDHTIKAWQLASYRIPARHLTAFHDIDLLPRPTRPRRRPKRRQHLPPGLLRLVFSPLRHHPPLRAHTTTQYPTRHSR
ncbi:MAG: hypothetical protein M1840_001678 [Geoglossum simile]|nr:MAG: hypothetical protein M1840_001678 [Geoglossum simile]